MIEKVTDEGRILAIIIRSEFKTEGIEFFTPEHFSQQLGYMNRARGHIIFPHKHPEVRKVVLDTSETLIVKSGKVKVSIYNNSEILVKECIISKGDVILLAEGGHGFEMLENSEIIEVKQGPHVNGKDKIKLFNLIGNIFYLPFAYQALNSITDFGSWVLTHSF